MTATGSVFTRRQGVSFRPSLTQVPLGSVVTYCAFIRLRLRNPP
jgi:hypothetical protein